MATWSTKRRWSYISILTFIILVLIVIPGFFTFYKSPTCFDGVQNEGEFGIDCGGPCQKLCQSAFLPAKILWSDSEVIAPGTYNLAAYIQNPNIYGVAVNVPYTFSFFDDQGVLITQVHGTMVSPPNRDTLAFAGAVKVGARIPAKNGVTFTFDRDPIWIKAFDSLGNISIGTPEYKENSVTSSAASQGGVGAYLQVPIGNRALVPYTGVTVFAVLYDRNGNHVGFSKTYLDEIPAASEKIAPFTWPYSFAGSVASEEILPVVDPVLSQ